MLEKLTIFLQKTLCLHKNLAKNIKKKTSSPILHGYLVNLQMSEACFCKNEEKMKLLLSVQKDRSVDS